MINKYDDLHCIQRESNGNSWLAIHDGMKSGAAKNRKC